MFLQLYQRCIHHMLEVWRDILINLAKKLKERGHWVIVITSGEGNVENVDENISLTFMADVGWAFANY